MRGAAASIGKILSLGERDPPAAQHPSFLHPGTALAQDAAWMFLRILDQGCHRIRSWTMDQARDASTTTAPGATSATVLGASALTYRQRHCRSREGSSPYNCCHSADERWRAELTKLDFGGTSNAHRWGIEFCSWVRRRDLHSSASYGSMVPEFQNNAKNGVEGLRDGSKPPTRRPNDSTSHLISVFRPTFRSPDSLSRE